MKRKTAKEILVDSFRELAERKSIDKITVREITENCGYSSATFYRNFRDKYDLIAWEHTRGVAAVMDRIGTDGYPWERALIDGAKGFEREKDYLANLFLHTSGHDSFIRYMTEINYNALKKHIEKSCGSLDEVTEMYLRVYCYGTVMLTCEWVLGLFTADAQSLAEVYEKSLPEPLRPYLYESE